MSTVELSLPVEEAMTVLRALNVASKAHIKTVIEDADSSLQCRIASRELRNIEAVASELERQIENYHDLNRQPQG